MIFSTILLLCALAEGQSQPASTSRQKRVNRPVIVDEVRWRSLLDQLSDQARTLSQEKTRPFVIAEVADAYWNLNQTKSGTLFMSALDAALSLKGDSKDANTAIRFVLTLAAKRDSSLAKRLIERLEKDDQTGFNSTRTALDLLESDPQRAAQYAQDSASAGPSVEASRFIFRLAKHDSIAAERVYRTYLSTFAANPNLPLAQLLTLGGYPFGYGETYSFAAKDSSSLFGLSSLHKPHPNPELAITFLNIAFKSIRKNLALPASSSATESDGLNSIILFMTTYLSPEVARYRPDALEAWQLLHQQALNGTSGVLQRVVAEKMQFISENRAAASQRDSSPQSFLDEIVQETLARAEKMPDECMRDRLYAEAAIVLRQTKNHQRALDTADRIKSISMRDSVRQYLYYDMARSAIEVGDISLAREYAKRIDAPEQLTLLYVKMAGVALRRKDPVSAAELLRETRQQSKKVSEPSTRASILLAAAAVFAQFDRIETNETLRDAIEDVNRTQALNVENFTVSRKVNVTCSGDSEERWYGGSDQAERYNLLETLATISTSDVDGTLLLAENIKDPAIRVRAQASIVKGIIKEVPRSVNH